jgi:cephalosporin hydroxylase
MPSTLKNQIAAPWRAIKSRVYRSFFTDLIRKTRNFSTIKWNNNPTWQNVLDLWNIQEAIFDIKPELIIETGTNQGGSSYYYAQLLDLIGHGKVVTVDIEKLHNLSHPRVKYLIGSSTDPEIFGEIRTMARACKGPVLVILDSDHSAQHVALRKFRKGRPGPLPAIRSFVSRNRQFVVDREKCDRFLVTHHPDGWLKRCA